MRIHDITAGLSPEHKPPPDTPPVRFETLAVLETDGWNALKVFLTTHHGTHMDAPYHYDNKGLTVPEVPLETLIGPCFVLDCRGRKEVGPEELARVPERLRARVLLRTDNSETWTDEREMLMEFVPLSPAGGKAVVSQGTKLVGTDGPSIEPFVNDTGDAVHKTLCPAGVIILEGLRLAEIAEGEYELVALPLKAVGADAFPVRAVLIEREVRGPAPAAT